MAPDLISLAHLWKATGSGDRKKGPAAESLLAWLPDAARRGRVVLKIHPDRRSANLYPWLLGDPYLLKRGSGVELPYSGYPYSESPDSP